jgi:mannose-6-phosphate isomerase
MAFVTVWRESSASYDKLLHLESARLQMLNQQGSNGLTHTSDYSIFPLAPVLLARPWGGSRLRQLYGKECQTNERIGESWEVVDRPIGQSTVTAGPLRGATIGNLWAECRFIFGARGLSSDAHRLPLLVKLLDASESLSVQVHPTDVPARQFGGEPKTETWLVLNVTPDACVYAGLRDGVDSEEFAESVLRRRDIVPLLRRIEVNVGDIVHVPAGRVHALGAGCLVLEVQQSSETTYRIFDWNRQGEALRALHIREALASIDFEDVDNPLVGNLDGEIEWFTRWYRMRNLILRDARQLQEENECAFVTPINGTLEIGGNVIEEGSFALLSPSAPNASPVAPITTVIAIGLGEPGL